MSEYLELQPDEKNEKLVKKDNGELISTHFASCYSVIC